MSETYCVYKSKKYSYHVDGKMLKIISNEQEEGFENYIGITGRVSRNLFSKLVSQDELDIICSEKYEVKYMNRYFEPTVLNKKVIEENNIELFTSSEEIAKELNFIKKEQFIFEKKIDLKEIEELLITQTPLMKFKDEMVIKTTITQEQIKYYFEKNLK